jgi:hypothetical protein
MEATYIKLPITNMNDDESIGTPVFMAPKHLLDNAKNTHLDSTVLENLL